MNLQTINSTTTQYLPLYNTGSKLDLICFSHLRWNFVYQRPQHLMTRFAKHNRVFLIEEPFFDAKHTDYLEFHKEGKLTVVIPHLQNGSAHEHAINQQIKLLKDFFEEQEINNYFFWYYTPMALAVGNSFEPKMIVYDCMDELSLFKNAPKELKEREKELFAKADLVFTGGYNLYYAKKNCHHNIHPFPSSIDKHHFSQAREDVQEPEDQKDIPHPRFGFYGVIDERFDIGLIEKVAKKKPEWQFIILGPVVKIDPEILPKLDNIHYLGGKKYHELPMYLSGWDIAIIPFLRNNSTKYISPTKTPEYLAGGKPVISTSIKDVVTPYGVRNLVHIADTPRKFIKAAETELKKSEKERSEWLNHVNAFLSQNSWDKTWSRMNELIESTLQSKASKVKSIIQAGINKEAYV